MSNDSNENWYTKKRSLREWIGLSKKPEERLSLLQWVIVLLFVVIFFVGGRALRTCMASHDGFWDALTNCALKLEFMDFLSPRHGNGYVKLPRPPATPAKGFEESNLAECQNPVLGNIATIYQLAYPELEIEVLCNKQDGWRVHGFPQAVK